VPVLVRLALGFDSAGRFGQSPGLVARSKLLFAGAQRVALGLERVEFLAGLAGLDRLPALSASLAGGVASPVSALTAWRSVSP
jgi:hypothetical protein